MTVLSVNTRYNFSVHAPSVLGSNFRNAELMAELNYRTALKFGDVVLRHRQVYPYLPADTESDLTKYNYYLFKIGDKEVVLADVWILPETVEVAVGGTYTVRLLGVAEPQVNMIREQLRLLGISFEIAQL